MNYDFKAGVRPEIDEDGYITGAVVVFDADSRKVVADCNFEYNPKNDDLTLRKYSEPGHFTGSSYEVALPEVIQGHIQKSVEAIEECIERYVSENIQYWYAQKYPEDTKSIADMNHEAEFGGLKKDILDGYSADDYLGVSDSTFRSRVFEELSKRTGLNLETIHELQHGKNAEEPDRTYRIFQLKRVDENRDYSFESLSRLQKHGLKLEPARYEEVYRGVMKPGEGLEDLYHTFNVNHPEDFRGHSMSVSDVVVISENGQERAYFCDDIGFTEVPGFVQGLEIETPSNDFIKDWYSAAFPTDDLAAEIDPDATFEGLKGTLLKGEDAHAYIGVGDSVVRERCFSELADREGSCSAISYLKLSDEMGGNTGSRFSGTALPSSIALKHTYDGNGDPTGDTTTYTGSQIKSKSETDLAGLWEKEYTITYTGLTDATADNLKTSYFATETFTLIQPTKPNYTFTGWTGSNGSTPEVIVTVPEMTMGDLSYKANWFARGCDLTVTNSVAASAAVVASAEFDYRVALTSPVDALEGTTSWQNAWKKSGNNRYFKVDVAGGTKVIMLRDSGGVGLYFVSKKVNGAFPSAIGSSSSTGSSTFVMNGDSYFDSKFRSVSSSAWNAVYRVQYLDPANQGGDILRPAGSTPLYDVTTASAAVAARYVIAGTAIDTTNVEYWKNGVQQTLVKDGDEIVFSLKDSDAAVLKSIPMDTVWSVTQDSTGSDGFVTKYQVDSGSLVDGYTASGVMAGDVAVAYTNTLSAQDMTLSNTVTGNLGSRDKSFTYYVNFDDGSNGSVDISGVEYWKNGVQQTVVTDEGDIVVTMAHGNTVELKNVPSGVIWTVTEADYSEEGYTTTYSVNSGTIVSGRVATGTLDDSTSVSFTNHKSTAVPTEIRTDLPWVGMTIAGMAVIGLVLIYIRKRKLYAVSNYD